MSRVKFNISKQDVGESLTLWATRLKCLHRIAFPDDTAIDSNLNVKDRFIAGMNDVNQKKYVLEQRRSEHDLNKLLQLGLKHEAVQLMIQPQVETTGYNMLEENKPKQTEQVNMIKQNDNTKPIEISNVGNIRNRARSGDWSCTNCNSTNFGQRKECYKCRTPRQRYPAMTVDREH